MREVSKLTGALLPPMILIMVLPLLIAITKPSGVVGGVSAADVNFQQVILPVRFVYLDNQQSIVKIYNNTQLTDPQYLLKFFDSKGQEIVIKDQDLLEQYFAILEMTDPFGEGYIFTQEDQLLGQEFTEKSYKIELRDSDLGLEEVYTYI